MDALRISEDVSVGDWIKSALAPWEVIPGKSSYPIGIAIPSGFECYVLVRHTGPGDMQGNLGTRTLSLITAILSKFTESPRHCYMALWDGKGWMHSGSISAFTPEKPRHPRRWRIGRYSLLSFRPPSKKDLNFMERNLDHLQSNTLPQGIMMSKRMRLTNRDYLLMRGKISDSLNIGYNFSGTLNTQSPNLMWPEDRKWVLASEIDFNATLIAGSSELIKEIMRATQLVCERFNWNDAISDLKLSDF